MTWCGSLFPCATVLAKTEPLHLGLPLAVEWVCSWGQGDDLSPHTCWVLVNILLLRHGRAAGVAETMSCFQVSPNTSRWLQGFKYVLGLQSSILGRIELNSHLPRLETRTQTDRPRGEKDSVHA